MSPNLLEYLPVVISLIVLASTLGFSLIPISIFLLIFFATLEIVSISLWDSALIRKIFFLAANSISSYVLPTPEKTIFLGCILDFKATINSPLDTTSAPRPNLPISLNIL